MSPLLPLGILMLTTTGPGSLAPPSSFGSRVSLQSPGDLPAQAASPVADELVLGGSPGPVERFLVLLEGGAREVSREPAERGRVRGDYAAAQERTLEAIRQALGANRGPLVVHRRFRELLNGFSLDLGPGEAARIRDLEGIVSVEPDRVVEATLDQSVPRTGAPEVWASPGVRGAGVVIAVVDTGIAYRHPDLGGTMGPGSKVLGGHDFVNDDGDPDDDHGHGTHVASTAAGTGPVPGVAPEARLLGYKVLDKLGRGFFSNVIAGVEMALDPDGVPETDDGADVITLSLGAPGGSPDDAASLALDRAVDLGAVVTVAAGNSGPRYRSINSPGTSRKALTVGAVGDNDEVASFSSRGPSDGTRIKPDLAAPGTGICAAWPSPTQNKCRDNDHREANGTSMATPHVAGAAALLRQLHPQLGPQAIQALLVGSVLGIRGEPMQVGAGRLDVARAARAQAYALPTQIVFPPIDFCATTYGADARITLHDVSGAASPVLVEIEPQGQELPIRVTGPSSLPGGGEAVVDLAIRVPTSELTIARTSPYGYAGHVVIRLGISEIRIPYFVTAQARLPLELDLGALETLAVHDGVNSVSTYRMPGPFPTTLELPSGAYHVIALYRGTSRKPDMAVIREDVEVGVCNEPLSLGPALASVEVALEFRGPDGSEIPSESLFGMWNLAHRSGWSMATWSPFPPPRRLSPASDAYTLEWEYQAELPPGEMAVLTGGQVGIGDPLRMASEPGSYTSFVVQRTAADERPAEYLTLWHLREPFGSGYSLVEGLNLVPLGTPARRTYHLTAPLAGSRLGLVRVVACADPFRCATMSLSDTGVVASPLLRANGSGGLVGTLLGASTTPVLVLDRPERASLDLDLGPPLWLGQFQNSAQMLTLKPAWGSVTALFLTQTGSTPLGRGFEYLLNDAAGTSQGQFGAAGVYESWLPERLELSPGPVELRVHGPAYRVAGAPGRAEVEVSFDSTVADRNPPQLVGPWLYDDGVQTNRILGCRGLGTDNQVVFEVSEDGAVARVEARVLDPQGRRRDVPVRFQGGRTWTGNLTGLPVDGLYGVELSVTDKAGNRIQYTANPAFHYEPGTPEPEARLLLVKTGDGVQLEWDDEGRASQVLRSESPDLYRTELVGEGHGVLVDRKAPRAAYYTLRGGGCVNPNP